MTRRDVWLIVTSLLLGPAIGALTFMLFVTLTDATSSPTHPNMPSGMVFVSSYWPVILTGAYVLGAVPGLVSAAILSVLTRVLPKRAQRLLAAPVVGAAVSIAIFTLVFSMDGLGALGDARIVLSIVLAGAVAALACLALVELFHPWRGATG